MGAEAYRVHHVYHVFRFGVERLPSTTTANADSLREEGLGAEMSRRDFAGDWGRNERTH